MKKITYSKERKLEIVAEGDYKGRHYVILNLGWYPTAYVEIDKATYLAFDELKELDCHGGITYNGKAFWNDKDGRYYIGWDYGHLSDYNAYCPTNDDKTKWTTEEIYKEVVWHIEDINEFYED